MCFKQASAAAAALLPAATPVANANGKTMSVVKDTAVPTSNLPAATLPGSTINGVTSRKRVSGINL